LRASGNDLIDEVREALARQDRLRSQQGKRYLSETALKRYAFLEGEVSRKISRLFPTWEGFIQADADHVAREIGANQMIVQAAQTSLKQAE